MRLDSYQTENFYDETGNVRKIPDARAFRPLEPGMLGLKRYHVETCGRLVFVDL